MKQLLKIATVTLVVLMVGTTFMPKQAKANACCIFCICSCSCSPGDCAITTFCTCSATVFSCYCGCAPASFIGIPPGGPELVDTAAQFSTWLVNYGGTDMITLSNDVNAQITAINNSDDTAFSNASFSFISDYNALSTTEKTAIQTTWGLYAN